MAEPRARPDLTVRSTFSLLSSVAYSPAHDADWHLLAGDEAALPAIASATEALPPHVVAIVLVEVDGGVEIGSGATAEINLATLLGGRYLRIAGPVQEPLMADLPTDERVRSLVRERLGELAHQEG